jgi:hypothetical protein
MHHVVRGLAAPVRPVVYIVSTTRGTIMIKHLFQTAAACAVLCSGGAYASTFDFSYTFADGQQVTGDFTGTTANGGQTVTNIGNIQLALNGISFAPVVVSGQTLGNATLQLNAWNPATAAFTDNAPATIYANGAQNNFIISDVDAAVNSGPDYEFAYLNDAANGIYQVVAANYLQTDAFSTAEANSTQLAIDSPNNAASWTLTEVAPVPIPATLALFASGLGLVGISRRRRQAG